MLEHELKNPIPQTVTFTIHKNNHHYITIHSIHIPATSGWEQNRRHDSSPSSFPHPREWRQAWHVSAPSSADSSESSCSGSPARQSSTRQRRPQSTARKPRGAVWRTPSNLTRRTPPPHDSPCPILTRTRTRFSIRSRGARGSRRGRARRSRRPRSRRCRWGWRCRWRRRWPRRHGGRRGLGGGGAWRGWRPEPGPR